MAYHKVNIDGPPDGVQLVEYKRSSVTVSKGTFTSVLYRPADDWLHSYHQKTYPDGSEDWTHSWSDPIRVEDMRKKYVIQTRIGPIYAAELDGRWYGLHGDDPLGSTDSPESVAQMLAEGECGHYGPGETESNIGQLKLPADLHQWQKLE